MNARDQLLALQWVQLKHDEGYHKDVLTLPVAQRVKHMALHNAKYTGYFLDAVDRGDEARLRHVLTDAFIIALASANIFNQDLGRELDASGEEATLRSMGATLAASLGRVDADPLWLVRQYARHNGQLAKLCESLDHLEAVPFREGMRTCIRALMSAVLAEAAARQLDLPEAYEARVRSVERCSIFHGFIRRERGKETDVLGG